MGPLIIRGHAWRVVRATPGDPLLVDQTGTPRLATCDPRTRTIRISTSTPPGMLDRVLLHEVAHAVMWEAGISQSLPAEELLAWFLETHSIEVLSTTISALGRGVCVDGLCIEVVRHGTHALYSE